MKNILKSNTVIYLIAVLFLLFSACRKNIPVTVTDIDGNMYHTVIIGKQVWMKENLKVTRYRNGDRIPNISGKAEWYKTTTGAYCNYRNSDSCGISFGRLYNWYAVHDIRNIAPEGWHVPTDEELTTLIEYLGGDSIAGGKMKENGTYRWIKPNKAASDESKFCALPAGFRDDFKGAFQLMGYNCIIWSSTTADSSVWTRILSFGHAGIFRSYLGKSSGASIRCIRD